MDDVINLQVRLLLKQLQLFGKSQEDQLSERTVKLLMVTRSSIDELVAKTTKNDSIGKNDVFRISQSRKTVNATTDTTQNVLTNSNDEIGAIKFNPRAEHLIRLRNLNWTTSKKDILKFLGHSIWTLNGFDGILFIVDRRFRKVEALVQLKSARGVSMANSKHSRIFNGRYVEVLEGNADQFKQIISKRNHLLDDKILLVCNLSSEVTEAHIRRLFNGFQIDDIRLSYFDKTKEIMAFVQFLSISDADAAIELFGQKILKKPVEIFRSSEYERNSGHYEQNLLVEKSAHSNRASIDEQAATGGYHMVMATGFPSSVTKDDVHAFFDRLNVFRGDKGIYIIKDDSMKVYVQFASKDDQQKALAKDMKKMYMHRIRVFKTEFSDYLGAINKMIQCNNTSG